MYSGIPLSCFVHFFLETVEIVASSFMWGIGASRTQSLYTKQTIPMVWGVSFSLSSDKGIQRRATRAILGWNSDPNLRPSYKSCLPSLNLLPISYWLEWRDLFFFYKSLHGAYNFPLNNFISFAIGKTRTATNLNLRPKPFGRTSLAF